MSLRTRLLLLSLLTLGLPWAGCQYAREMERALRVGQEAALLSTARSLSGVIASAPDLLYADPAMRTGFAPGSTGVFAPRLTTRPLLDAYGDEWPGVDLARHESNGLVLNAGIVSRTLYLHVEIDGPPAAFQPQTRMVVLTRDRDAIESAWSLAIDDGGPIGVRRTTIGAPWTAGAAVESRMAAFGRVTPSRYVVEMRMPLELAGERLAVFAVDAAGRIRAGDAQLGWLHTASEPLRESLEALTGADLRLSVVDVHGLLLARAGSLAPAADAHLRQVRPEPGLRAALYRRLLARPELPAPPPRIPVAITGEPVRSALAGDAAAVWIAAAYGDPSMIRAAVPLRNGEGILGALVAEQPADRVLLLRDAALARLLDVTLGIGIVTVLAVAIFSAWLAFRLRRLARAASTALSPEGKLDPRLPERHARDELGALARSFNALLGRLHEYTSYLRSLSSTLSHELRTPLAVVSSSLDNLDIARIEPRDRVYVERAREGTARLHRILGAMSEATRVEQVIESTERVRFDLTTVVKDVGAAYQSSFGPERITVTVPAEPWIVAGSPDLIAQLLDKLIANAQDFCPAGGRIRLGLGLQSACRVLFVENDGPPLPPELDGRLFESMTAARADRGPVPHLGLGLYIARLIAEFHGATISARNRQDGAGVIVSITWP